MIINTYQNYETFPLLTCKQSDSIFQGRSQEFSFTEARLKGKVLQMQGVWPAKLTQYIKVTFSILLNSYDNTMAYVLCMCVIVCSLYACCKKLL